MQVTVITIVVKVLGKDAKGIRDQRKSQDHPDHSIGDERRFVVTQIQLKDNQLKLA